ncbi:hypothetical protein [Streptomyces sp. NPDC001404]|uniref:hypothetical protein n=1 Tax=Streptomyces sp. NPDC001404 TaxID=3364571 RepID=UPI0036BC57CC
MGIFSKRPAKDPDQQDREIQQAKYEGSRLLEEVIERINNGTATRKDKRVFNAGRTRAGRIK